MKKVVVLFSLFFCYIDLFAFESFESGGLIYNVDHVLYSETVSVGRNTEVSGNIVIPSTVTYSEKVYTITTIEDSAFFNCSTITSISLPNSVTTIGKYAFRGCSKLESINIPDGVTAIKGGTFSNDSSLTSIILPDGVTSLGASAFYACTSLTTIKIPDGVTSIGGEAFSMCYSLTSISIPDGVTSIDQRTFRGCNSLQTVRLPDGLKEIRVRAFEGCIMKTITIPNSVTSIGTGAFWGCSGLTSITIPDAVTSIGGNAFYKCSGLTSVTISNSLTSILGSVFEGCTSLTSITIPSSVTSIGVSAFRSCTGITSITIPSSVTSIGGSAFRSCTSLTSITISDGVTTIGDYAFWGCTGITSIIIPNSVASIGTRVFNPENLESIVVSKDNQYYNSGENSNALIDSKNKTLLLGCKNTQIPDGVTSIGDYAFYECTELATVNIPDGVTSIGDYAFYECTELATVNIPDGVTSIGDYAFYDCSTITSMLLPNSVVAIGKYAFRGCSNLTTINVPSGVTTINEATFSKDSSLTSIVLPEAVTSMGAYAFYGCSGITTIKIPNGVTSIEKQTFYGCKGLNSITLPNSLKKIESEAFYACSKLTSVVLPRGVTSIGTKAFSKSKLDTLSLSSWVEVEAEENLGLSTKVTIYIPCGLIDAYQADEYWKKFPNIVEKKIEYSPEIALVTASQEIPEANLVVWQKEQTIAIDYYTIYRELAGTGTYEELATIPYDMQSIYVDEHANNSKQANKYKISATNFCGNESPVSPPHKTIHLEKKGSVSSRMDLVWDNYEGVEFDQYSVYRVTSSGIEEISKEVAVGDPLYIYEKGECVDTIFPLKTTITYTDVKPVTNTRAYYVAVKLPKEINVNDPLLKAEGGPFTICISNIAEVENETAVNDIVEYRARVYAKEGAIVVENAENKPVAIYNAVGHSIAREIGDCTVDVQQNGAYIVVVGEKTYKVIVE